MDEVERAKMEGAKAVYQEESDDDDENEGSAGGNDSD